MLRTWLEPEEITVPPDYMQAIGGDPMVSQVLYARGYREIESARGFLSHRYYHPSPPSALPGLQNAVELLHQAIVDHTRIGVWGDFDVDGQTATTLLVSALQDLGGNVVYHIPIRAEESHGISLPVLKTFLKQGVGMLLTCDTGIASHEAVEFASLQGIPVIITDHHDLPEVLPHASAIVNPKLLMPDHPLSYLPGVGVAYKVAEELSDQAGNLGEAEQYLDLVALGIVADIALLRGDNRYLLQRGLDVLRHTTRAGLRAIMELAELNQANLTEEHIGYIVAPRMNALGRLDDANSMVEMLTTTDMGKARVLALELEGMNAQRKLLTDQVFQAAQAQITADPKLLDFPVLVLAHASWPAGVIGIVASRLVEQYHRPVILLASPGGQEARGSARSIEGINITSAIAANQALLKSFGGHPMAAGLSMDAQNIPEFRQAISRTIQEMGVDIQIEKDLPVDGYLSLPELSLELVEDLERLAPFGAGNPPLVFATRNLRLTGYAAVGRSGEHLQLTIEDELGYIRPSIWWQGAGFRLPEEKFDLAYSVRASTYKGQRDIQIEWIDYRLVETQARAPVRNKPVMDVVDLRTDPEPLIALKNLQNREALLVWGEGQGKTREGWLDRLALHPSEQLVIGTIPPGPNELQAGLRQVNPQKVYLLAIDPGMDQPKEFLDRLVGLVKSCIKSHDGLTSLPVLAAATAQRITTVQTGLEWLDEHGYIKILSMDSVEVRLSLGQGKKKENPNSSSVLNAQLAESAAFRRYYRTARPDRLVLLED